MDDVNLEGTPMVAAQKKTAQRFRTSAPRIGVLLGCGFLVVSSSFVGALLGYSWSYGLIRVFDGIAGGGASVGAVGGGASRSPFWERYSEPILYATFVVGGVIGGLGLLVGVLTTVANRIQTLRVQETEVLERQRVAVLPNWERAARRKADRLRLGICAVAWVCLLIIFSVVGAKSRASLPFDYGWVSDSSQFFSLIVLVITILSTPWLIALFYVLREVNIPNIHR